MICTRYGILPQRRLCVLVPTGQFLTLCIWKCKRSGKDERKEGGRQSSLFCKSSSILRNVIELAGPLSLPSATGTPKVVQTWSMSFAHLEDVGGPTRKKCRDYSLDTCRELRTRLT